MAPAKHSHQTAKRCDIGVGTFLKVGGPDSHGPPPQTFETETSPTPKISFLLRFRHFLFAKMPYLDVSKKKRQKS